MGTRRYSMRNFPTCFKKIRLATLTRQLLETIPSTFLILETYFAESYEYASYPRQSVHNMTQNNANILGPRLIGTKFSSGPERSSREPSSQVKKKSNLSFSRKKLKFDNEGLGIQNTKNENRLDEIAQNQLAEMDQFEFAAIKEAEMKVIEKEGLEFYEKCLMYMINKNLMQIRSVLLFGESEGMEVEMDIYFDYAPVKNNLEKSDEDSDPEKTSNSTKRATKSLYSPPSKRKQSSSPSSTSSNVNYSDPKHLYYLKQRLLSILSNRKLWMKQIHNCFEKFLEDVSNFNATVRKLKSLVIEFCMVKESKLYYGYKKLYNDFINKAGDMSQTAEKIIRNVKTNNLVWEKCLKEIEIFEKEHGQFLSANQGTTLTIRDLQMFEQRLNGICKQADGTLTAHDKRKTILFHLLYDFELLIICFVKFLIIKGVLRLQPPLNIEKEN